ncbi:MAG: alpha/beta fold hydrolase [Alphaproteobacteria bacterium]|nr:alpha/beta fold hydrolase [Alphaproteobacteria bacterium]
MMESRLIQAGRAKVRVYETGAGTPLLFLHGTHGILPNDSFLAALAQRYRVYAPCLPGYEDSDDAGALREMLDFTLHGLDLIEALGLRRPFLVGHSLGGMIAAEMAAVAANDIDRLALIAPHGLWLDSHPVPDLFAALPFDLPGLFFHDVALGTRLLTDGLDLEDPKFLADFMVTRARRLGTAGKILFAIPDRGFAERAYRVKAKTVVVWGEADRMMPPAYGEAYLRLLPAARLVRVPAAGHMVTHEQPDVVVAALAALD